MSLWSAYCHGFFDHCSELKVLLEGRLVTPTHVYIVPECDVQLLEILGGDSLHRSGTEKTPRGSCRLFLQHLAASLSLIIVAFEVFVWSPSTLGALV